MICYLIHHGFSYVIQLKPANKNLPVFGVSLAWFLTDMVMINELAVEGVDVVGGNLSKHHSQQVLVK